MIIAGNYRRTTARESPKSETRNPKEAESPKCEKSDCPVIVIPHPQLSRSFRISGFGFPSEFRFRFSDFIQIYSRKFDP
jgi:hypothetical protein